MSAPFAGSIVDCAGCGESYLASQLGGCITCREMLVRLRDEGTELRADVARLTAERDESRALNALSCCLFCGEQMAREPEVMLNHALACQARTDAWTEGLRRAAESIARAEDRDVAAIVHVLRDIVAGQYAPGAPIVHGLELALDLALRGYAVREDAEVRRA